MEVVLVAAFGSFLTQLDATVVNVSLSSLALEFHSGLRVIQWVTSGYLLALALMLPLNAWLVERIGAKRLYLICFTGFTLSSALCALSWSANSLIAFRVLQGISGGLMAPMAQLMIARAAGTLRLRIHEPAGPGRAARSLGARDRDHKSAQENHDAPGRRPAWLAAHIFDRGRRVH